MPARVEEVHHAQEEGVIFNNLTNPVAVLHDERGEVTGMKCIRMELGEPDASGRRRPIPIEGSEFDLEVDTIVIAVGTNPNPLIKSTTEGLDVTSWGGIITDEFGATSREGIFAGGDAVTGAATVISAAGAGKVAAEAIDKYLKNKHA
jgi:glutamate synthase (NADPH/NADH) small chain